MHQTVIKELANENGVKNPLHYFSTQQTLDLI